jgi:hypothetical protein
MGFLAHIFLCLNYNTSFDTESTELSREPYGIMFKYSKAAYREKTHYLWNNPH